MNSSGVCAYTQGSVQGTGTVTISDGVTRITAYGTDLALIGEAYDGLSIFTESAPAPEKAGTFTLT